MKRVISILAIALTLGAQAQVEYGEWQVENYDWADKPTAETREWITEQEEAILDNVHFLQYRYSDGALELLELIHRRVWVGDEKTIQSYNKLYVSVRDDDKNARIKARVLQPDGTVINLDRDDIEEGKDEDGRIFRYFALDGVKEGSIVEYLFLTTGYPRYNGTRVTLQRTAPIYNLKFELVVPANLIFKLKSYNALNQPLKDTVLEQQNRYYIHQDTVPKFEKEDNAFDRAHRGYLLFALDENRYNGMRDITSFGYTTDNIFKNINIEPSKSVKKQYTKILEEIDLANIADGEMKILALENYLKENFIMRDGASSKAVTEVDQILKNHVMNETGCLRLYYSIFKHAAIPCQLVFTSERSETPLDDDFETNIFFAEDLLYFPDQDVFLSPTNQFSRLGNFNANLRNTKAIFVEEADLGEGPIGLADVRFVPPQLEKDNKSDLLVEWHIAPDGEIGEIQVKRKTTGLQTGGYQAIAPLVPEDKTEEFEKEIFSWMYSEVEFDEYTVDNLEPSLYGKEPIVVSCKFEDEVFAEPGATSTVLKVGALIGPQAEMYLEDSVRTWPINHGFPRWYHREIKLYVPEGYQLKNMESLNMLVKSEGEDPDMVFKSTYTFENNVMHIVVDEWYRGGEYPASLFETYRNVINAAADFNKKYVVLEQN